MKASILLQNLFFMLCFTVLLSSSVLAEAAQFTVVPEESSLTLSEVVDIANIIKVNITEQFSGSLSTGYSGTINADISDNTIAITDAKLTAENSGDYSPGSNGTRNAAPANYGGYGYYSYYFLTGYVFTAIRELEFNIESQQLSYETDLPSDASSIDFEVTSGFENYSDASTIYPPDLLAGSFATNNSGTSFTITRTENIERLTLEVDFTVTHSKDEYRFSGTIVAEREIAPVVQLPGDVNHDLVVNSRDLDIVRGSWGLTLEPCSLGDANCDGIVNSRDLDLIRSNWGSSIAAN